MFIYLLTYLFMHLYVYPKQTIYYSYRFLSHNRNHTANTRCRVLGTLPTAIDTTTLPPFGFRVSGGFGVRVSRQLALDSPIGFLARLIAAKNPTCQNTH